MQKEKLDIVLNNKNISDKAKQAVLALFKESDKIQFGKIGPRLEGYIYTGVGFPRATAVLQMDGSRAAALLEWAKREVVEDAKERLKFELHKNGYLTNSLIDTILDMALESPDKQRDSAAHQGSGVHDNIEKMLNGLPYVADEPTMLFKGIWEKEGFELICTELPVVYRVGNGHGFGGKLDVLAYKDDEFVILDNKTSRSVHGSYALQTSAYSKAVEQMTGGLIKISRIGIVHLPNLSELKEWQMKLHKKMGNFIECNNIDEAFNHFMLLLEQYYKRNNKYF